MSVLPDDVRANVRGHAEDCIALAWQCGGDKICVASVDSDAKSSSGLMCPTRRPSWEYVRGRTKYVDGMTERSAMCKSRAISSARTGCFDPPSPALVDACIIIPAILLDM